MRRLAVAFALAGCTVAAVVPGVGAQDRGGPGVRLVSQTPFVGRDGALDMCLQMTNVTDESSTEVAVSVYPETTTRSAFTDTLTERGLRSPLSTPTPASVAALSALTAGACGPGNIAVRLPTNDPQTRLRSGEGIYPVRVDLRDTGSGDVFDHFVTHLVYLPEPHTGPPLNVAIVVPVHAPPSLQPDGTRRIEGLEQLRELVRTFEARPGFPVVLHPTPETLDALAGPAGGDAGQEVLASLRRGLVGRELLAGPYVPLNLTALYGARLEREVGAQVGRGSDTLTRTLFADTAVLPDIRTWATQDPLDEAALSRLRQLGVERMVVPEQALARLDTPKTLTQPFGLSARAPQPITALAADPGLSAHFSNEGNPVLRAHQMLADLAQLFLDEPGARPRGVVAMAPRDWRATRAFIETLMDGLAPAAAPNQFARATTLETIFSTVRPAETQRGDLVRRLEPLAPGVNEGTGAIAASRQQLDDFSGIVDPGNERLRGLEELLLVSESADLRTARARSAYTTAVDRTLRAQLRNIEVPRNRSITLTAREGVIPITFQNKNPYPVNVTVRIQSDRLLERDETRDLVLSRKNTTERFDVVTRGSGEFPLLVTVESADGTVLVEPSRITVRSTAGYGVGVVLSAGAALFLAAWWARHFVRGRRARRLVPA